MSTHSLAIVNWNRALLYQDGHRLASLLRQAVDRAASRLGLCDGVARSDARAAIASTLRSRRSTCSSIRRSTWGDTSESGICGERARLSCSSTRSPTTRKISTSPQVCCNAYQRVPDEAFAMYGSRHFADYHALLTLSDAIRISGHRASPVERRSRARRFPDRSAGVALRRRLDHARVFAFVERQVSPAGGSDDAELSRCLSSPICSGSTRA